MTSNSTCILVASCDKYSDLWVPYFKLKETFWPNCPYPVYLGTDSKTESRLPNTIQYLHVGTHTSWTAQVRKYVAALPYEYVLFSLEDFFIRKPVDQKKIDDALIWFQQKTDAASLRLIPLPSPSIKSQNSHGISQYDPRQKYYISTQASFWRKAALAELLTGDRSPWQFELEPPPASQKQNHFATNLPTLPYRGLLTHHVVEKGKWIPHEYLNFKTRVLFDEKRTRELMQFHKYLIYLIKILARRTIDAFTKH